MYKYRTVTVCHCLYKIWLTTHCCCPPTIQTTNESRAQREITSTNSCSLHMRNDLFTTNQI